ncbi:MULTISPECIES: ATP-binding cassette domain-containing protein [Rhodococcus]|uniref:hypothetical protein n=1 Tax=Rhodococcus TaxID=1827 RepID=UPI000A85A249|nr:MULTISPECIES: hypothetical protein [Rhodococcus]MCD2116191.1 hypothetical protein [Rhodococcus pyridinivorans]MCZ4625059.1 hypothetical protein [Rhodococcus pyridinivorans]MCZ4646422.1 hypothetical protein [Rhodococcus pyridinivorans]MDJ0481681.1 hypothetical protein [Rhodococcus pyridinivorans]MDV7252372.1 hypothetical protein [Rhodococcus pyridinivorans]
MTSTGVELRDLTIGHARRRAFRGRTVTEIASKVNVARRGELVDVLGRLAREQNLAVVMSTHELELALRVSDRMWLLEADRTLTCDTPAALAESGRIGAAFDRGRMRFDPRRMVFDLEAEDSRV